jgi:serine/threonine-protein kinase HipA
VTPRSPGRPSAPATPRATKPVTRVQVGLRFGIDRRGGAVRDRIIGTLALHEGRPVFFYDDAFCVNPLPLSPYRLAVGPGPHTHDDRTFDRLPGLLADALPDGWGRRLQDRAFRRAGRRLDDISPLDRLLAVGHAAMGALVFEPASPLLTARSSPDPLTFDLGAVAAQTARLLEGSEEEVLDAVMLTGGSPGGARPKAVIGLAAEHPVRLIAGVTPEIASGTDVALPDAYDAWLVKFANDDDRRLFGDDVGAVEAAYARVAEHAGVIMPPTRQRHFAVQRFDRFGPGGRGRVHMHTAGGLLHASFREPSLDYEGLLALTYQLTGSYAEVRQLFRRMAFNVFTYNRDDHAKNFAFLMEADGSWSLAPAYDLTYSVGMGGRHTTSIGGVDEWPTLALLRDVGRAASLEAAHIAADLDQVRTAVADAPSVLRDLGCSPNTTAFLVSRFDEVVRRAQ